MVRACPNCGQKVPMSGSVAIPIGKYWTVSNHWFCNCGMIGGLWIGHGKMHGKEKIVWESDKQIK